MVADALSQKSSGSLHYIYTIGMPLLIELRKLDVEFRLDTPPRVLATLKVRLILVERILAAQRMDEERKKLYSDMNSGKVEELIYSEEVILKFKSRLYVPNVNELK